MNIIPYSRQKIDRTDINEVVKVLKSNFLTQGEEVPKFEKKVRAKVGAKFSVAVNSATSALHIACMSLNIKKGDIVWTSANSFVASINCANYLNAKIDFVDIDLETYNLSINSLEKKLKKAKQSKKLPKVLILVHFAGLPCDLKKIWMLSKKYNFKIIEDASHAIGSKYRGDYIGNCRYSDIAIFSFHPVKIITSGEGGMCLTNSKKIYKDLLLYRSHGITKDKQQFQIKRNKNNEWYYEQQKIGYNYRLSDIHASLGRSQLEKLDKFIKIRNQIARKYKILLKDLPLILPKDNKLSLSSYHLYVVRTQVSSDKKLHKKLFDFLRIKKIWCNLHYIPIYNHPYYKNKFNKKNFINSEIYYNSAISIPIFPGLKNKQMMYVKNTFIEFFNKNSIKKKHKKILFLTGLPSSGKTTISEILNKEIIKKNMKSTYIDGDKFRKKFNYNSYDLLSRNNIGFKKLEYANKFLKKNDFVIVSGVAHERSWRESAKKKFENLIEIFLDCPKKICRSRDFKKNYLKAEQKKIKNFIGVNQDYQKGKSVDLILNTYKTTPNKNVKKIINYLKINNYVPK